MGIGVVGEDIVSLVLSSAIFFEVTLAELPTLDPLAFSQYTRGLQDAGWQGQPPLARLGYTMVAALRYGIGVL